MKLTRDRAVFTLTYEFNMIKITNTLTSKKEKFVPLAGNKVRLYVCGVTPYDFAHIGHGRVYVTFDVLFRVLKLLGYDVAYCRNFTDIDDKLINKALKEYNDGARYLDVANKFIKTFTEDMAALHCESPTYEPRVTETIPEIIAFVQGLIEKGKAYVADGDVYYRIASFPEYGKLSKQKLDELRAGARIEVNDIKEDPLDFALWKSSKTEPAWQSPWGTGRPGWHIECSAMADKFLGKQIDIHAGGMDLIFPHHENEIAQTEGLFGHQFAQYWMHNAFVRINKEKMSKSLGNFFTLRQIFEQYDPMVIRFYYLSHQYRAPLDFAFDDIDAVQKSYQRLCKFFASYERGGNDFQQSAIVQKMLEFVCDDLNTPGMFGVLFENLSSLQHDSMQARMVKTFLMDILGLSLQPLPEKEVALTPEIERLIQEREQARSAKNWALSDALRDQLKELGYEAQDKKLTK